MYTMYTQSGKAYQVPSGHKSQRFAMAELIEARHVALLPRLAKSPANDHRFKRRQPRMGNQTRCAQPDFVMCKQGNKIPRGPGGERLCNRSRSSRSSTSSISTRQHSHLIMSAENGASIVFNAQPFRTVDCTGKPFVPSLQFPKGRIREQLRRVRRRDQPAEGNGRSQNKDRRPSPISPQRALSCVPAHKRFPPLTTPTLARASSVLSCARHNARLELGCMGMRGVPVVASDAEHWPRDAQQRNAHQQHTHHPWPPRQPRAGHCWVRAPALAV
jgi:hypothetical protein